MKVLERIDLKEEEMIEVMTQIMEGKAESSKMAALLVALRMKGETVGEIVGAARVMREKAESVRVSMDKVQAERIVDTCGTGGDGGNTFNISTATAFVAAGAGITVAKHGNRAVSSRSGRACVLKSLGVNIEADKKVVEQCLEEAGIGFLFAPMLHGAMKHAAGVRKELGIRTIFNLLGPLTNPAGAHAQVVGVFDRKWVSPVSQVLKNLGCHHAFVVHGEDGLDEITLTGNTKVYELNEGKIMKFYVNPENFGLARCKGEDLAGGTPEENATIIRDLLSGKTGSKRDIVLLNAAAAIVVGGKVKDLKEGLEAARESIDSGAAQKKLEALCKISQG